MIADILLVEEIKKLGRFFKRLQKRSDQEFVCQIVHRHQRLFGNTDPFVSVFVTNPGNGQATEVCGSEIEHNYELL
ncbi:MAG: hypothetical protein H6574_06125 [Lewinellaceae bacterium]|nr:hypothetical protein [Lewinellaceae bacterium]